MNDLLGVLFTNKEKESSAEVSLNEWNIWDILMIEKDSQYLDEKIKPSPSPLIGLPKSIKRMQWCTVKYDIYHSI